MFKLKPGNVFQKINKMDKKQAYTWGAIIIVCFVALLTLASFMGDADESSFDDFNTRGYDLAQMPFLNDEAEEYLLASKYPDMQGNNSTMLYSAAEKEARQEADAQEAAADGADQTEADPLAGTGGSFGYDNYSGGGYSGGAGRTSSPTQIGQLNNATMSHASASGVSTSWGAPRGDFSPYESQEKGSEVPVAELRNQDARRALAQFAQTSRAAAGLRDSKAANAKRALMGGSVRGSEAFTADGVDLSKSGGLAIDTNAPVSSADLGNLDNAVKDANKKAQDKKNEDLQTMEDRLLEQLWSGMVNLGINAMGQLIDSGIDSLKGSIAGKQAYNQSMDNAGRAFANEELTDANKELMIERYGADKVNEWMSKNKGGRIWQCESDLANAGTNNGRVSLIPSDPGEAPKMENFVTSSDSSNDNGTITLGKTDQKNYEQAQKVWQEKKDAFDEYQQASDSEKLKIQADRAKHNQKVQNQSVSNVNKQYKKYAKANNLDSYKVAVDKKNTAKAAYTGRDYSSSSSSSSTDAGESTTSVGSTTSASATSQNSSFDQIAADKKYDDLSRSLIEGCRNHAAPQTCLDSALESLKK